MLILDNGVILDIALMQLQLKTALLYYTIAMYNALISFSLFHHIHYTHITRFYKNHLHDFQH